MEVKCSCLLALLYKVPSFENSCVVCMGGKVWKVMLLHSCKHLFCFGCKLTLWVNLSFNFSELIGFSFLVDYHSMHI